MVLNLNKDINLINKDKGMRVRPDDLRNAIHPLNINKKVQYTSAAPLSNKRTKETVKFTFFGEHESLADIQGNSTDDGFPVTDNDEKVMARVDHFDPPKYYVKVDSSGKLYDPIGLLTEGTLNKDLKYKKQWEFREVNKKVFSCYLNFLKTKNHAWLNSGNRENI
jgi:hypothetical protein